MEQTAEMQPVITQPATQPEVAVPNNDEQSQSGLFGRIKNFASSLNPWNQVDEADHQTELARDPSA